MNKTFFATLTALMLATTSVFAQNMQHVLQRFANTFAVEFSETPVTGTAANASSGTGTPGQQVIPGTNTPVPGNIKITPNFVPAATKEGY